MDKAASLIAPAAASDRFKEIDALRGFALFGIMLANLPVWVGLPFAGERTPELLGAIPVELLEPFSNGLLDGKFYTIFSLLFGLGFSLQLERLEARGGDGRALFMRRMAVLLLFGLVHVSLIWSGDILMLYALLGFTLPLFRPLGDQALLLVAFALLFVLPFAAEALITARWPEWHRPIVEAALALYAGAGGDLSIDYFDDLAQGGWASLPPRAAADWLFNLHDRIANWRFLKVLGTMLIGMWAGRMLVRGKLLENRRLLWSVLLVGLTIGVPANIVYAGQEPHSQTHWSSQIGTAPLGFAYAAAFLLAIAHLPRLRTALAAVGRMALTNYLATSVVFSALFYGIGFGMMGTLTMEVTYAMGLAFFALMTAGSLWWLTRHRQGPMEALWRRLTYPAPVGQPPTA